MSPMEKNACSSRAICFLRVPKALHDIKEFYSTLCQSAGICDISPDAGRRINQDDSYQIHRGSYKAE